MLSVEQALELARAAVGSHPVRPEHVPLSQAGGRVLGDDVRMDHDVPPFRRAAMDGYALAGPVERGGTRRVTRRVAAGQAPGAALNPGEAVRVMTGAPVPDGSRCVVPFEQAREQDGVLELLGATSGASHIVEPGEHVAAGAVVLTRGERLGPAAVGVLAAAGVSYVPVAPRPSAAVLATGSELVAVSQRPGPAQIRNSNNPTLAAQARAAGAEVTDLGLAADEPVALAAALARGLAHDLLLVSGGVSMGDLDLVPACLLSLSVRCVFHGWGVQPGGPLWLGVRERCVVLALPGNPAASFVGFEVLGVPLLRARLGLPFEGRARLSARWLGPDPGPAARRRYRPVRLASGADGVLEAQPVAWKGSGDPFALARAQALAELPEAGLRTLPGQAGPAAGLVSVLPLGGLA